MELAPSSDVFDVVAARRSFTALTAPGPTEPELAQILTAAVSAPDHGRLRPWRFTIFSGPARESFGEVLADAAVRRDPGISPGRLEVERRRLMRAPLVIAVGARITPCAVDPAEQRAAVAAAVQNLMLGATALGYGSIWRTGAAAKDEHVKAALGLRTDDAIVGFVYVGTPFGTPAGRPEPSLDGVVSRWTAG
jgi:nitroreductase